ncbi:MAG: hypothetical protein RI637_10960, partial [Acidimicrobiia bacterium]|nr:hypothetical protein [Acidimicrobiia bacterium]
GDFDAVEPKKSKSASYVEVDHFTNGDPKRVTFYDDFDKQVAEIERRNEDRWLIDGFGGVTKTTWAEYEAKRDKAKAELEAEKASWKNPLDGWYKYAMADGSPMPEDHGWSSYRFFVSYNTVVKWDEADDVTKASLKRDTLYPYIEGHWHPKALHDDQGDLKAVSFYGGYKGERRSDTLHVVENGLAYLADYERSYEAVLVPVSDEELERYSSEITHKTIDPYREKPIPEQHRAKYYGDESDGT